MRFYDLKGLSDEEASSLIAKCPQVELQKVLESPEILSKKVLVFRGNYDGYATDRLCARTFEYIPTEDRWKISDFTIYDMFGTSFDYHFSKNELESKINCNSKGFVMDA